MLYNKHESFEIYCYFYYYYYYAINFNSPNLSIFPVCTIFTFRIKFREFIVVIKKLKS